MTPDCQIRLMNALRCSRSPSPKSIILIHLPCAQIDRLLSSLRSAQECRGELVRQSAMAAGHHNTHVRLVAEVHGPLGESGTGSRDGGTHRMSVPCKGVTREHWSGAGGQHQSSQECCVPFSVHKRVALHSKTALHSKLRRQRPYSPQHRHQRATRPHLQPSQLATASRNTKLAGSNHVKARTKR